MQDDKLDCRKSAEISKLLENDKSVIDYHLLSELLRKVDLGADRETINLEVSKIAKRNKAAKISSLNDQDKILVLFKKTSSRIRGQSFRNFIRTRI